MSTVISVENLSKQYRLGEVGTGSLAHDVSRWWHRLRGRQDPFLMVGVESDGAKKVHKPEAGDQKSAPTDSTSSPVSDIRSRSSSRSAAVDYAWALRDITFEVKQGEVLGIIGHNGAGKSTLLKILSRVTRPTRGEIKVKGRIASLLEVGTGFHPDLTGRENIFLNGAILGMRKREIGRKFEEIVEFSGCARYIDTPVKRYSSGMYVRLAFAVAAHLEPEILIVDEVLAVGDAEFQKKCLGKMKDVAGRGRTVLFVSHNMSSVRSLCDQAMILAGGSVAMAGTAPTVIDRYLANLNTNTTLDIPCTSLPRSGVHGSRLKIHHVRINEGRGIWHGEPLEVEFNFESLDDIEEVSFGIGFGNRDGLRILSVDSDIPGARWTLPLGTRGTARLKLSTLHLEPDFYTIDIGARSGDIAALEYFPQCGQVTVLPGPSTPPVIAMRDSGRGGIRMPACWELVPA